ncbi:hypothetical protein LPTSP4_08430 [Leptospira ryugenii]|uniref:Integrase catalytic domain-containing protein n=1 Tax=Leptospira ryugenii TaxID=1917863 RepID=A0A2P2DXI3_9LEPT|nr:hypothetical protein LPTSP4_08430 [Leptospira ryugenii]
MSSNLTGGELGAMVSMAYKAMDVEFKKQYDPREEGKGITYETQSAYSNARQARAYQQWASSGDGSNFKWDNKNYFLVGEVEYGTFGKNHHDEFWRILTTAENLTFIEEAYAGQQRLKAQQRAHREQIQDTAVAESFFSTSKREIEFNVFLNRNDAEHTIFNYIDVFYNRQRSHSFLRYVSPEEFELKAA